MEKNKKPLVDKAIFKDVDASKVTSKNKIIKEKLESKKPKKSVDEIWEEASKNAKKDMERDDMIKKLRLRIEVLEETQFTPGKALMLFIGSIITSGLVGFLVTHLF